MVTRKEIQEAYGRIRNHIRRTPVLELEEGAPANGARVVLKLELMQQAGSFKLRGAFNCVLSSQVPEAGIIAASGGNHGAAVACVAQHLGHRAEIFVPTISSPAKVDRLRQFEAHITITGKNYAEALAASRERLARTGALSVHAYDDPRTVAGAGTAGLEMDEQAPGLDTVLIAVGGGGLISGVAAWFENRVRVIGVEPVASPTLAKTLEAGHLIDVETGGLAADSLGATRIGDVNFPLIQRYVERVVLVTDDQIREAQRFLWKNARVAAEPGGAAATAAVLSGAYQAKPGERIGVMVSGGNVDLGSIA